MVEYVIEADNLSKMYKGISVDENETGVGLWVKNIFKLTSNKSANVCALKNVTFNVKAGEAFGIYGSNGAGKTTLVKVLSGLLCPSVGSLKVNGSGETKHIKNNISYVSTNGWMGLEWQLTAKENLLLYGNLFGLSGLILDKKCDYILRLLDIYDAKDKYISQLSAGMRQKITIARGLLVDKPIIYLDEPTVSLDVNSAINLRSIIKEYIKNKDKSAVVTSHNPEDIGICDRIMFLYKGEIAALGTMDELKKPVENIRIINMKCKCFETGKIMELKSIGGVKDIFYEPVNTGDDYLNIKIHTENDGTTGEIIDFFIRNRITVLDLKTKKVTLQDIYEYYADGASDGKIKK